MNRSVAAPLGLAGLAALLLSRNWRGWTDPLVDFGRELYIPWRIVEGDVLYRDIAYLDGPFSPYWNALCVTIFPMGMRTLEIANIAVIAGVSALIFSLLQRLVHSDIPHPLGRRTVATAGVALFLCAFAVNLAGAGENMNWVAPYSHGITHGVALSLLSIWLFARHLDRGRTIDLALAGLSVGFCSLTKPEVFAAAGLAIGVGMLASLRTPPAASDPPIRRLMVLFGSAVVPGIGSAMLLAQAMPVSDAIAGTLGGWSHLFGSDVGSHQFYKWIMGIVDPVENLTQMGVASGIWFALLVPAFAGSVAMSSSIQRDRLTIALYVTAVALVSLTIGSYEWGFVFRPMIVFNLLYAAFAARKVWRLPSDKEAPRAIIELCVSVLGLALLAKIFLKSIVQGYGFALLVPGMIMCVFALLHAIPVGITRRGGDGRLFGRVGLAALAMVSAGCMIDSESARAVKTVVVGKGADSFLAEEFRRPRVVINLAHWITNETPPGATLLVLPEGVMVNYLTRRINPTRHVNFMPTELVIFGEQAILKDFKRNPPDVVALVHRDTSEYGLPLFGTDYGRSLLKWARDEYRMVIRIGPEPLRPDKASGERGWEVRVRRRTLKKGRVGS